MEHYDLVVVGSVIASSFFLKRFMELHPRARILVIERGEHDRHEDKIRNRNSLEIEPIVSSTGYRETFSYRKTETKYLTILRVSAAPQIADMDAHRAYWRQTSNYSQPMGSGLTGH